MIRAEVKPIFSKEKPDKVEAHAVFIGERELGRCKLKCDAMMHMHLINEAMEYNESVARLLGHSNGPLIP